ncbi:MAG: hypothetical protein R3257_01385 [bacterium]|nr:hypothetical protein [bacterium]
MMNRTEAEQFIRSYLEPLSRAAEGLAENDSSPYTAEIARNSSPQVSDAVNPYQSSQNAYASNMRLRSLAPRTSYTSRQALPEPVAHRPRSVSQTREAATRGLDEGLIVFSGRRSSPVPPAMGVQTAVRPQAEGDSNRLAATRQYEDLSDLSPDPFEPTEETYRSLGMSRSNEAELDDLMRASFDGRRSASQASAQRGPLPNLSYQPRIHLGELDPQVRDVSGLNREMRTRIDRIIASGSRAERMRVRALEAGLDTPSGRRLAERARRAYRITVLRRSRLQARMNSLPDNHRARVEAYVNHDSWRDFAMRFRVLAE